ncbi:hypothetical protein TUM17384_11580 [Shewanella algae]|nr:hypothetical protein TUM17384_11580 [Shewanella algae]
MFIRAHEAGYMCVATLSERDLPVLASERCPYKLFRWSPVLVALVKFGFPDGAKPIEKSIK